MVENAILKMADFGQFSWGMGHLILKNHHFFLILKMSISQIIFQNTGATYFFPFRNSVEFLVMVFRMIMNSKNKKTGFVT